MRKSSAQVPAAMVRCSDESEGQGALCTLTLRKAYEKNIIN
jgi:hypothetical protein